VSENEPSEADATKGVLLVVAFLLVLVARILQVAGVLGDGLTLIYLSIGASVIAAGILLVTVRRRR
jgi:hypothetical protein